MGMRKGSLFITAMVAASIGSVVPLREKLTPQNDDTWGTPEDTDRMRKAEAKRTRRAAAREENRRKSQPG
jgi:hypothetical protein